MITARPHALVSSDRTRNTFTTKSGLTSVQCNQVDDGRCRSFVATPLVNSRSYAYVMKQADKEGCFRRPK